MALALSGLPVIEDDRILVGTNSADDAGVVRLSSDLAIVHTVDVFAPVVNDAYTFGRIAAINSLSDVYAMGGEPFAALNVVGFPSGLETELLTDMLRGGQDAVLEAGAVTVGGHTFQDSEVRYGLAVTGTIHPDAIITNSGAKPGDTLILTKALGTGTVVQAMVSRGAVADPVYRAAVESMTTSNRQASLAMRNIATACTDVTGFGLIGHSFEMAAASNAGITIIASELPILPQVMNLIKDGVTDGGSIQNRNSFEQYAEFGSDVPVEYKTLLFGSETSGGLLISVSSNMKPALCDELSRRDVEYAVIGYVTADNPGTVKIDP